MSALIESPVKAEQIYKASARLGAVIRFHLNTKFEVVLAEGADINSTDIKSNLVSTAIQHCNEWAFKELLKRKADIHLMGQDKISPWISAAFSGNETMARILCSKGADINDYCSSNALGYAIGGISSYALVELGKWHKENPATHGNDPILHAQIKDWFYRRGEFAATNADVKPFPKHDKPLRVSFDGKIDFIGFLLSIGVLTGTPDRVGRSADMVVADFGKYPRYFLGDPGSQLKFVSTQDGVNTFTMMLNACTGEGEIDIILDYSSKKLQAMFAAYHQSKSSQTRTEEDWKRIGEAVQMKVTDDLTGRIDHSHKKMEAQLTVVKQQVQVVEAKVDAEHKEAAELKEKQEKFEARQSKIDSHLFTKQFNISLNAKLRAKIMGAVSLHSGDVTRELNTKLDLASKILDFVATHLPVFGSAVGLLAMGVQKYSDMTEDAKHKHVAQFFPTTDEGEKNFSRVLALELTEHYSVCLTCPGIIKDEAQADKLGEKLAAASYLVLLAAKPADKSNIIKLIFDEVVKNNLLAEQLTASHQSAAFLESDIDPSLSTAPGRARGTVVTSADALPVTPGFTAHKNAGEDAKKRGSDEKRSKWSFFRKSPALDVK